MRSLQSGSPGIIGFAKDRARPYTGQSSHSFILLLTVLVLFTTGYISLRFAGNRIVGDAANLTLASQSTLAEGTIAPTTNVYRFGFAYPALNVFLAHLTGLPVETLQEAVQPFLVVLLVPVAFLAFSRLAVHRMAALLATLLLFLQPDFIFESVRSSHGKLTWLLALSMLYILTSSIEAINRGRSPVPWILAFYLVAFGLITSSSFFAASYILAIAFAFLGAQMMRRLPGGFQVSFPHQFRRLLYVSLSGSLLVFLFIFYLYPPALLQFITLGTATDRIGSLVLGAETLGPSPYDYVGATWLSTRTYLALTLFNYLILVLSFIAWLRMGFAMLWNREILPAGRYLLWLVYAALAAVLALSVILDFTGIFSRNLQVRFFPHLMVAAIPMAALLIVDLLGLLRRRSAILFRLAPAVLVTCIIYFAAASLLKVTNEPLISNKWLFYTHSEGIALDWAGENLEDTAVWAGLDRRLAPYIDINTRWSDRDVEILPGRQTQENRHFLLSDAIQARAARTEAILPDVRPHNLVYDGGRAELYYRRPATPYRR